MPCRSGVFYQQFFHKGPRSAFFEIGRGRDMTELFIEQPSTRVDADTNEIIQVFQAKGNYLRKKEVEDIEEQGDLAAPNSWLRRLGATIHLKDFADKKDFLRGLISLQYTIQPDNPELAAARDNPSLAGAGDDAELQQIHAATKRLIRGAIRATKPDVVSWNVLFEVNRKELNKERSTPFHFRFKPKTRKKYTTVALQLVAYIIRAMAIEDPADRPPFKLSTRQATAYETTMKYADELTDIWAERAGNQQAERIKELQSLLEEAVLELYISVLDHFTKTTEYQSVLVSFSMVFCIRKDKTWESFNTVTSNISGLMAMSRLFLVKYTVDRRAKYVQRRIQQGQSQDDAEENSPSHFVIMAEMTRRFMVGGGDGWDTTPTQFMVRLRNFGMAADGNQAMPGSVSWDKETAIYKGIRLNVSGIQVMLHSALRKAESVLYKDLLFCLEYEDQSPVELGLPEIPWDKIIDNAADTTIGYSFVKPLFELVPESTGWLFRKVWADEGLRAAWVRRGSGSDFALHEKTVCYYGSLIETCLEFFLFLAQLSGGQAKRSWELLTIRHRNTLNGGIRNIFLDRGLLMIVTGYHKGFSKTERLKIIHHFLPREITVLFIYYFWIVIPFWEDAQANTWDTAEISASVWATEETLEDYGGHDDSHQNGGDDEDYNNSGYGSDSSEDADTGGGERLPTRRQGEHHQQQAARKFGPGRHWTSTRMTRILRRLSVVGCKKGFTISSWRHLSIAFARHYFRDRTTAQTSLLSDIDEGR
ncbi:hypothetical protein FSOLCH5_015297 [Fusarium solani]